MIEALQYVFMQRALIAGLIVAIICSILGVFLVLRRLSLISDGLAHMAFGGIAAGMFFGITPIVSALIFSLLSALGIQKLRESHVRADAAIAILFSFGLAIGVILISMSKGFTIDLFSYLFGSILAVSSGDLFFIGLFGTLTIALIWVFYKELFYITFNEESAMVTGLPVRQLNYLLISLTAVAVVISMQVVGILLVSSFMVIPATIAIMLCKGFKETIFVSTAIGTLSLIIGLFASFYFDLAPGGAIVFTLICIFLLSLIYSRLVR